jgi:hypothetical protein
MPGPQTASPSLPWYRDAGIIAAILCLGLFTGGLFYMADAGKLPPPTPTPPSLPLGPIGPGAFQPGAFPAGVSGDDGLPVLGTWNAAGGNLTGAWTSQPLTTSAAFLQMRVLGTLRPPATSLVLRTADGREVPPRD